MLCIVGLMFALRFLPKGLYLLGDAVEWIDGSVWASIDTMQTYARWAWGMIWDPSSK